MVSTAFLQPLTNAHLVRRAADAILLRYAHHRTVQLDRMDVAAVQAQTLRRLVRRAKRTRFGRDHDFARISSVADYQARVPLRDYEFFWNTYWKDAYPRIENQTWPGHVPYYALSSGTTSGATKYIPVTWEMVASNKKAAFATTALFRHSFPASKLFTGKFFFLGGSTDLRKQADGSLAGDLSGISAKELFEFLRPYTFPPFDLTLITDWEEKARRFAEVGSRERITAISGVPAWMHVLFGKLKEVTGKKTIAEIWPDLRLVIHGGTKFDPYRAMFKEEIGSDRVQFCEVYPCSEGFIATEDPRYKLLRIVPDHDIFFEFVPVEDLGKEKPTRHTLANVEVGVQYAVALTSCAGVWSYLVGDTVAFERRNPPLIRFTGRTKYFLSAFGEHLISEEVEKAVAHAAEVCGVNAIDFHVGPVFPSRPGGVGHHLYLIEFASAAPDTAKFAKLIDDELTRINEDYGPHRVGDLAMLMPEVRVVRSGGFAEWMKARGKYGGQNKVPRMDNSGAFTSDMAGWFAVLSPLPSGRGWGWVLSHRPLTGLVPAVLTPFDSSGALNLAAVEPHAELLARDGVSGVFVGGTTGEFPSLTADERLALASRWAAVLKGSAVRLIVHVGSNCLAESKALAAQAESLHAAAISAVAPSYFKPKSLDVLVRWCAELSNAAPGTPFYFYDIPSMTGVALPMAEFLELAPPAVPTLAGIKFTNPDLMTFQRLLRAGGGRFDVLFGMDEQLLAAVALGAKGAVGSGYNFAAPLYNRMCAAARASEWDSARSLQYRGVELVALLMRYGYLAAAKEVMRFRGIDLGPVRLPHVPLTPEQVSTLRGEWDACGGS